VLAKQEEMRELQDNLLQSRAPTGLITYYDTYAKLYCKIERLSVAPTAIIVDDVPTWIRICCPITQMLMVTPAINADSGMAYDCVAIATSTASEWRSDIH
jgi:hypothetical protein